jgi:SAM-dependent methyltransferase
MLEDLDAKLAEKYGSHTSYSSGIGPSHIEYYGDSPVEEMKRLLDSYAYSESSVLDIGCGAGQTLCRLAQKVRQIWGIDRNDELLQATRLRAESQGLTNVTLVQGNSVLEQDVEQLPDNTFDLAFSQRGPNLNVPLLKKLRKNAFFVQELVSSYDGYPLREIFGRTHYTPYTAGEQPMLLASYAELGLFPVSVKEHFYDVFYRDIDHLETYLQHSAAMLSNWRLADKPYEPSRDRAALELYARYNTTPNGIRIMQHRRVFVLRRASVYYYPVDGTL